ncbi:DNA internalization-related competence protein ComEC/Rec2 [metagenome]|uniref:DNA internalization-related competence protein ComEC/Rec2 n=1 Tax=metagenome TaxID=256318 RepID=A0A2P2BWW0_9ZZZZ
MTSSQASADPAGADLRMPLLGAAAWAGALLALVAPRSVLVAALLVLAITLLVAAVRGRGLRVVGACAIVGVGVAAAATLRTHAVRDNPLAALAAQHAVVHARLTVSSDPVRHSGRFEDYVTFRARAEGVSGRGRQFDTRLPVLVIAPGEWSGVRLGSDLEVLGRLGPSDDHQLAAVLSARGRPRLLTEPDLTWRAAASVRRSIRDAAQTGPADGRALVPALVDGDDGGLSESTVTDFRTTGLTHLLAVSGTNLTLVVGFVLVLARWCGVRGRWQVLIGALGIVAFVLIARTEPSVVRAAAMGAVGLIAMGSNGRERGSRALGVAVVVLLLFDPWLATSAGFVLSALATAGILFLAPGWRDALMRWSPRWVAEAVAVPSAAQLACTPVVAAISGQVSLVAVAANLAAAPAVGPTTILGLLGGLTGLVAAPVGRVFGWGASWSAAFIVSVAERGAALPVAAVDWGTGSAALVALTGGCVALCFAMPSLLRRRWSALLVSLGLVVVVAVPLPTPGWPPEGWVMVVCDVGQGDAIVLRAGAGAAVVVDAGPDPDAVDGCLTRLGVRRVPLVVLTHFHADHVAGLPGVVSGRQVGAVEVTALAEPLSNVHAVLAETEGVATVRVPSYGETQVIGDLTLQVLGPASAEVAAGAFEDDGTGPNNASLVLLVEVHGLRILLTGDVEPEAQRALSTAWPELSVDVLKVPHHGSRYQDLSWLTSLDARAAVVSVGADNDYGHPSRQTLGPLESSGVRVARTDLEGDVAVTVDDGAQRIVTRD